MNGLVARSTEGPLRIANHESRKFDILLRHAAQDIHNQFGGAAERGRLMKHKALFIGVNNYEDAQIRDLNYSLSDAHALKTLFELFGYQTDILENPAKSDVFSAVKKMTRDLSAGDLFFFYFAGHGWTTTSGKHLLFCSDDMYEDLRDDDAGISFDKLKRKTSSNYNRAFVLDTCRSDFLTGTRGGDTTTRDLRPIGELVRDVSVRGSLAVLRSCSQYEHALEIESRKHGLFTLAMMDVLRQSHANGTELLFGESRCDAVTQKMAAIACAEGIVVAQTPEFAKSGVTQVLIDGSKVRFPRPDDTVHSPRYKRKTETEGKTQKDVVHKPVPVGSKAGERRTVAIGAGVSMDFVWCPATTSDEWKKISGGEDTFVMGSPVGEKRRNADEFLHHVRLTRGFWMSETPVMQIQWENIMGVNSNKSPRAKGAEKPVTNVAFEDALDFIRKVRDFGCPVWLPTEAQWEYACRAGKKGRFGTGEVGFSVPPEKRPGVFCLESELFFFAVPVFGWLSGLYRALCSAGRTEPIKQGPANAWGLYDMHGNCGEWCVDWYGPYSAAEVIDPSGPQTGKWHVVRGMRKTRFEWRCRSATRWWLPEKLFFCKYRHPLVGLRLVINPTVFVHTPASEKNGEAGKGHEIMGRRRDENVEFKAGTAQTITLPGGAKMEMIYCPPGEFSMGSPATEKERDNDETQHRVRQTRGFWLGKYPVTQLQWKSVMGDNPAHFKGENFPVEKVSWDDCQTFINNVNAALGCDARLPTEAEWEYACRAGTTTAYSWGNALNGDKANCDGCCPYGVKAKGPYLQKTSAVGRYAPNPWGFHDMHGNVWEWCDDWYGDYPASGVMDPTGPASGFYRVLRGGSWNYIARHSRSASRFGYKPCIRDDNVGFRLCCSAESN